MRWLIFAPIFLIMFIPCLNSARAQPAPPIDALPRGAVVRLGSFRLYHEETLAALAFSPDGKTVATCSSHTHVTIGKQYGSGKNGRGFRLWDLATGLELPRMDPEAAHTILDLTYSLDGKWLATVGTSRVQVWNCRTHEIVHDLVAEPMEQPASRISFSPDGKLLHIARINHDRTAMDVVQWELPSGKLRKRWLDHAEPVDQAIEKKANEIQVSLQISPDGKWLFRGFRDPKIDKAAQEQRDRAADTTLRVNDAQTGQFTHQYGNLKVDASCLRFSANGKRFAIGGSDAYVGVVGDARAPKLVSTYSSFATLSGDSSRIAVVHHGSDVHILDSATGEVIAKLGVANNLVGCPRVLSHDGQMLAVGEYEWLRFWSVAKGEELFPRPGHFHAVTQVGFSRNGQTLTSSDDYHHWIWDVNKGLPIPPQKPSNVLEYGSVLARSKDGRFQAGNWNDGVYVRESSDKSAKRKLDCRKADWYAAWFTEDSRILSVIGHSNQQSHCDYFAIPSCKLLGRISLNKKDPTGGWSAPEPSPDGKTLAAWAADDRIVLLNYNGEKIRSLPSRLRARPDDEWHITTSRLLLFSPDGRYLFSSLRYDFSDEAGPDICLWDVNSGKLVRRLDVCLPDGSPGCVACAAFSPDCNTLAVGQYLCTFPVDKAAIPGITIWEVASGQARHHFKGHKRPVTTLAFAPDGRTLASGSEDGTVLLWNLHAGKQDAGQVEELWSALAAEDASVAFQSIVALSGMPDQAFALIKPRIQPVAAAPKELLQKLIADLDSANFVIRDRAAKALEKIGEPAVAMLEQAIRDSQTVESRRRLEAILSRTEDALSAPTGERLRSYRALEILDRIGGDDAHELITRIATGDNSAQLTREARALLERRAIRNNAEEPFVGDPAPPQARFIPEPVAPKQNAAPPEQQSSLHTWIFVLYLIAMGILVGTGLYRAVKQRAIH